MTIERADGIVAGLVGAYQTGAPTPAAHTTGPLDAATAYQIQRRVFEARHGADPAAVRGYKISLAVPGDQRAFGTDRPLFGRLAAANLVPSPAVLGLAGLFRPIIEPEVVFVLDDDLYPGASIDEVLDKTRVAAGFDLPDSRYAGWPALDAPVVTDLIADNACIGLVVHAAAEVRASMVDLPTMTCTMTVDGQFFGVGTGADVSGNPAALVAWLSSALAEQGLALHKGDRVSSGAVIAPSPLKIVVPGAYRAEFSNIGIVELTVMYHLAPSPFSDNNYLIDPAHGRQR